ncbi:hypothetical protein HN51_047681, partial [Arachis hypogaea]
VNLLLRFHAPKNVTRKKGTYAQANKHASADDEDMDPTQYLENKIKYLADQKAEGINPYPQNRNDSRGLSSQKLKSHYNTFKLRIIEIPSELLVQLFSRFEQKKQKISEVKTGIDEAELLIRKIDLEVRGLQPNIKAIVLAKLREYKSDLNNIKSEVKKIVASNLNPSARYELLESSMVYVVMASADQKE